MAGESEVKQVKGAKEIEAPTMARRSFPLARGWDRLVQLGVGKWDTPKDTTEWYGLVRLVRLSPNLDNRIRRRAGSSKLYQTGVSGPSVQKEEEWPL